MDGNFLMVKKEQGVVNCEDERYKKTERKLRKTYEKVGDIKNVRGFCRKAEVSSATFYRHIHSVKEIFERQFLEILGEFKRCERSFSRLLILLAREKTFFRTAIQFGEWWVFARLLEAMVSFERFSEEVSEWMRVKFLAQAVIVIFWWCEREEFSPDRISFYVKKLEQIKKRVEQEGMD